MKRLVVVLAAIAHLTFGQGASAAEPAAPSPAVQEKLDEALRRGRLIYAYDQATWHSTDELLKNVPQDKLPKAGGWVVEPQGPDVLRVTYFRVDDGAYSAMFRADMKSAQVASSHLYRAGEDVTLPASTLILAKTRMAASQVMQAKPRCTEGAFNTVVLPPRAPGATAPVYLLSSMVTTGVYPFGGHYRLDVDADGQVRSERAFTKSCLNMDLSKLPPGGGGPGVSHMLDPTPTEIHVFLALWTGKPLFVMTGQNSVWLVDGTGIKPIALSSANAD